MAGWNLSEGKCISEIVSEEEFWEIINNIISNKTNKTTSYKYAFFKAIIDNIFNLSNNSIKYEVLFERFAEMYWNLVAKYHLVQIQATTRFAKSSVEIIIDEIIKKYHLDVIVPFESLKDNIRQEVVKKITNECSKYVIGAFFIDSNKKFYSFDKMSKVITYQHNVVQYIAKYKSILSKLNYFEWIKFLEKVNVDDNINALAKKLDDSTKRGDLSFYKDFLHDIYNQEECFYCGKKLKDEKIEMDHFIPWSYIKDDKQWNIVISCRKCNNSKRDKMPNKKYIRKLLEQNETIIKSDKFDLVKKDYIGYEDEKIIKIYESAIFNGFNEIWEPTIKKD